MKKLLLSAGLVIMVVAMTSFAFCGEEYPYEEDYNPHRGSGWGAGHMMGPGHGSGMHGSGWGMYDRGMMGDWHRGYRPRRWESMTPEQREKWEKMRAEYQMETLEIRKQLVSKRLELQTLWAQPDVDSKTVETLSDEVAELEAQLAKKRDKYLLQCRQNFGEVGWSCPGGMW